MGRTLSQISSIQTRDVGDWEISRIRNSTPVLKGKRLNRLAFHLDREGDAARNQLTLGANSSDARSVASICSASRKENQWLLNLYHLCDGNYVYT
jgi:hypothetical protein